MGNKISFFEDYLATIKYISYVNEYETIRANQDVSYECSKMVKNGQTLEFAKIIDVADSFECLTPGVTFDIMINGEIVYDNVKNFTLVPLCMQYTEIKVRLSHHQAEIKFRGFTLCEKNRTKIAYSKIYTKYLKIYNGYSISSTIPYSKHFFADRVISLDNKDSRISDGISVFSV